MRCLPVPLALAVTLLLPAASDAATFTFCMKWRVETADSGRTVTLPDGVTITEDHWATDKATARTAHGMLFTVRRPGLNGGAPLLLWANPATGCANLTDAAGTHGYLLRAYAVSVDAHGNTIRVVNPLGDPYVFDAAAVATSGTPLSVQVPSNPVFPLTPDQKAIGTLAAVSAFAAYRATFGVKGKTMDLIEGTASSAHSGPGVDLNRLESGYIRISIRKPTSDDPSDGRNMKFHIAHEMGHAWLLLHHGGGVEPNVVTDYDSSADPDACHYVADDGTTGGYTIDSLEHAAVGFREGAAHFYAARVWNDTSPEGVFTWFGNGMSLGRAANPDLGGGRTFQRCVTPSRPLATICAENVSTTQDWLRFWWAWHTRTTPMVSTTTIRDLYERTLDNGGLQKHNYRTKLMEAVMQLIADHDQLVAFFAYGDWNGISSGENTRCP